MRKGVPFLKPKVQHIKWSVYLPTAQALSLIHSETQIHTKFILGADNLKHELRKILHEGNFNPNY
jgi:hypothetical protein